MTAGSAEQSSPRRGGRGLLFVASIAAGIGNYAFGLLCVHQLGAPIYASIAAVTSVSMILTVPLAGLQASYGRDVAIAIGLSDDVSLSSLRAYGIRQALHLQLLVFVLAAVAVPLIVLWGGVSDVRIALVLPFLTLGATVVPILSGFLQGAERYSALSIVMGIGGVARVALAPLGILVAGAVGALSAGVVAALLATLAVFLLVRPVADRSTRIASPVGPTTTGLATVALISYAVLSNADLVMAPALMDEVAAGDYAAATIAGRGMAFVATTVSLILLTSTSRRISRGQDTRAPLRRTMQAVGGLGLGLAALCWVIPNDLYRSVFATTGDVNVLVAISVLALTAAGLVNNLLSYALAHRDRNFVLVVLSVCVAYPLVAVATVRSGEGLAALLLLMASACIGVFFARAHRARHVETV